MLTSSPVIWRKYRVALAMLSLAALGISGCCFLEYAKPIRVNQLENVHQQCLRQVEDSFYTAEEKKVAVEQLDRIQSVYLKMIEADLSEQDIGTYEKRVSTYHTAYKFVTGDRLLAIAQVRALRDDFLPASGLSDEEKNEGVKTCNEAICALVAEKLPLYLSRTPPNRDMLQVSLQFRLWRLRSEASRGNSEIEAAATTPTAEDEVEEAATTPIAEDESEAETTTSTGEGEVKTKPYRHVVDPDEELRQAFIVLEDALAYAKEDTTLEIPEGPCQVDLAVEMQQGVDEFLEKLDAD